MRADRKAMCLVAQPFDEIKHRIARLEFEGVTAGQEKGLHARVPIRALSDGNQRHIDDTETGERFLCGGELTPAAVDDDKVGPRRIVLPVRAAYDIEGRASLRWRAQRTGHGPRRLIHQALKAAAQDFPHHREIIAGREVSGMDVELAVLVFLKSLRTGDNHCADRVAALDVAIVVDLDAAWRSGQTESFGEHLEELALGRAFGKLARKRLARVGERVINEVLLLAPLRNAHLDLVAALGG